MTPLKATERVFPTDQSSAIMGGVVWAPQKSLWLLGHLTLGLAGGVIWFSWSAVAVMVALTVLTICLGHSVGMHRLLIHRSFETPLWLEHLLVWLGTLVGMAGPVGMFRIHDIRDWQQNQADCHSFARHDVGFWRDAFWQMFCEQVLTSPPVLKIEDRVMQDRFYLWLERTWRWQQLPLAAALFAMGGPGFVAWGVSLRIVISLAGHWCTVHLAHTRGDRPYVQPDIAVDGRNLPGLAILTFGESWHNNHHAFPRSARMGHHAGQVDPGWWVVRGLAALGLAWNIRVPDLQGGRTGALVLQGPAPVRWNGARS